MSYLVIARKWRPQDFDAIVGQEHVTRTLKNAIQGGRVAHAYLFSGPRGVGKTTSARILAKALNCEKGPAAEPCNECALCREITDGTSLDIVEIDGASNNSVDDIRDLRERVCYTPHKANYRIYIIDEVHMLSASAFNALLKTLEEPPGHVIFVMATTEPQKIPATILSRCQHFAFRRIPTARIIACLQDIVTKEKAVVPEEALALVARAADGSLRDAQSILEKVLSYGDRISAETVLDLLGVIDRELLFQSAEALIDKDPALVLDLIGRVVDGGYSLGSFQQQLLEYFRNLLIVRICGADSPLLELPAEESERLQAQRDKTSEGELSLIIKGLLESGEAMKKMPQPRIVLELYLSRLAQIDALVPLSQILERLIRLERGGAVGCEATADPGEAQPQSESAPRAKPARAPAEAAHKAPQKEKRGLSSKGAAGKKGKKSPPLSLHELWEEVIARTKKRKGSMAGWLNHGALLELNDEGALLAFDSEFVQDKAREPDNMDIMQEAIEGVLKRPVALRIRRECLAEGESLHSHRSGLLAREAESLKEEALAEPAVNKAMNIFQASLLEVKGVS